jgi:membrane protease YdiL (CAAX protease family)
VFLTIMLVAMGSLAANGLLRAGYADAGILANELLAVAGLPLAAIWFFRLDRKTLLPFRAISLRQLSPLVGLAISAVVLMDYATAVSDWLWPLPTAVQALFDDLMATSGAWSIASKFVVLCLVPGCCEEILFRGFAQSSLSCFWGKKTALLIAAFIFALLHGIPTYLHLYFFLGLLFGGVLIVTRSLWAAIFCHVFNNAWTFFSHVAGMTLPLGEGFLHADIVMIITAVLLTVVSFRQLLATRIEALPGEDKTLTDRKS